MSTFAIPEIETERTTLRAFRDHDLDVYASYCADPDIMRYVSAPLSRADTWRNMATFMGHWVLRGYGSWAIEERATGDLIGRIGLWNPEGWPGLEVGWLLGKQYWGHGFATEGGRAALAYARDSLGKTSAISVIHPDNQRSIALAERLGAVRDYETVVRGVTVDIYTYEQL